MIFISCLIVFKETFVLPSQCGQIVLVYNF
nr:MAG TPA: HhaI Restriction Endonuclease/DNA Complex, modification, protein-DNA complex, iodine [Caudoviricetes sp.]